ncbi:glutathione S-transferase [Aestuariibius sp. HNIBRBA575]|uniref:glutathione S-transferase n=1 Tax=Aestuariibius sp. HNIBRBA575 TaxID=3233343 RepID=UPI0034A22B1F
MFVKFGLPVNTHMAGLYSGTMAKDLKPLAPAKLVPVMKTPDNVVVGDTLAMAETLAERHPDIAMWPADPAHRAFARWMVSEMHSGYAALRGDCPMNLAHSWADFTPSDAVLADVARIEDMWARARAMKPAGPWLFGDYSLADVFFAPVAARLAGYGLPLSDAARDYVMTHLRDPHFVEWRAEGAKVTYDPVPYDLPLTKADWPVS